MGFDFSLRVVSLNKDDPEGLVPGHGGSSTGHLFIAPSLLNSMGHLGDDR